MKQKISPAHTALRCSAKCKLMRGESRKRHLTRSTTQHEKLFGRKRCRHRRCCRFQFFLFSMRLRFDWKSSEKFLHPFERQRKTTKKYCVYVCRWNGRPHRRVRHSKSDQKFRIQKQLRIRPNDTHFYVFFDFSRFSCVLFTHFYSFSMHATCLCLCVSSFLVCVCVVSSSVGSSFRSHTNCHSFCIFTVVYLVSCSFVLLFVSAFTYEKFDYFFFCFWGAIRLYSCDSRLLLQEFHSFVWFMYLAVWICRLRFEFKSNKQRKW